MHPARQDKPTDRRPYAKPKLIAIDLYGGEVLGIGCKTVSSLPSPVVQVGGSQPYGCGLATPCYEEST